MSQSLNFHLNLFNNLILNIVNMSVLNHNNQHDLKIPNPRSSQT